MASIDIEDDFVLCEHEQDEETERPPSPFEEDGILIDAITTSEDDELIPDAVMILEDDHDMEPSPSEDKGSLPDAVTTTNEEQYSSKTAAEIEALAETGAKVFFASLSESNPRAVEDHRVIVSALHDHGKRLHDQIWARKITALVAADIAEKEAKRLLITEETRQKLGKARKLREKRLARDEESTEIGGVLILVFVWVAAVVLGVKLAWLIAAPSGTDMKSGPRRADGSW